MPQCERPEIGSVPPCCPALRVAAPPDRDQPGACKCSICQLGHDAGLRWLDSASPDPVTLGTHPAGPTIQGMAPANSELTEVFLNSGFNKSLHPGQPDPLRDNGVQEPGLRNQGMQAEEAAR
jgi:hypothetical protein